MNSRMRFHVTAVIAILATVTVIQVLTKKPPQAPQQQVRAIGNRFIMVFEASWGLNCNEFIKQTIHNRKAIIAKYAPNPAPEHDDGQPKDLAVQKPNNVLLKVSDMCNTRETCEFEVSTKHFGDPYRTCNKALDISYRCFEYDRLRFVESREGQDVSIDCSKKEGENATKPQ